MHRPFLSAIALATALLLPACGTRSALESPGPSTDCGPWSVSDGAAGAERHTQAPFAVLDDGSVVLGMHEQIDDFHDHANTGNMTNWARKLGPDGATVWDAPSMFNSVFVTGVARDAAGVLHVVGMLNSGTWQTLGGKVTCTGDGFCAFVGTLGDDGTLVSAKVFSSTGKGFGVQPSSFAVTGDGRVTVAGGFNGTIDFGCGPHTAAPAKSLADGYLVQLSPQGECLWSRALIGNDDVGAYGGKVAVDEAGDVMLSVWLRHAYVPTAVDLGTGPLAVDTTAGSTIALARYTASGSPVFARVLPGVLVGPSGLSRTPSGDLILAAQSMGPVNLGGGSHGAAGNLLHFVSRFDGTGHEVWTRDLAIEPTSVPASPGFALALDEGGGFVVAGAGRAGMTIAGESIPATKLFAATFDGNGEPLDVHTFPIAADASVLGVEAVSADALLLVGQFAGTLDFGQETLVSQGNKDAFVARVCR